MLSEAYNFWEGELQTQGLMVYCTQCITAPCWHWCGGTGVVALVWCSIHSLALLVICCQLGPTFIRRSWVIFRMNMTHSYSIIVAMIPQPVAGRNCAIWIYRSSLKWSCMSAHCPRTRTLNCQLADGVCLHCSIGRSPLSNLYQTSTTVSPGRLPAFKNACVRLDGVIFSCAASKIHRGDLGW